MGYFVKRRDPAIPGSIPDVLGSFHSEVLFYREVAPVVGVRVPACHLSEDGPSGTCLVLEDLSTWHPGADPLEAARLLADLHRRWQGQAAMRWPWLRPVGAGADVVGRLFDRTWSVLVGCRDVPPPVRRLGERLVGRVAAAARAEGTAGPATLLHGDASLSNCRTSTDAEIALLDWEDVRAGAGVADLAWLLLSSVEPARWDEVVAAYGPAPGLSTVIPATTCQALLSLADTATGSAEEAAWISRITAAGTLLA
ncbi:phosphotransferase family protein [Actinopolymorpha pittospori]|uniref:Aminoglycoside phosphotransferase domain-containing protein n=1 Tax=Actinopolymorpha pittospori TaxID=648752 RepID=A0A927N2X1_9ACTN|nr:phosphotransferase [Actinopolymorpha pittospori]MBE1609313.1 hypothetical protein [Actinopolymorpha pittospori]